jgi:hypothetical protein
MSYFRHCRESGNPDCVEFPGFRLALAIASLAGMTPELCSELLARTLSKMPHLVQHDKFSSVILGTRLCEK